MINPSEDHRFIPSFSLFRANQGLEKGNRFPLYTYTVNIFNIESPENSQRRVQHLIRAKAKNRNDFSQAI